MRRTALVAVLTLLLAAGLGLWRTEQDIDDELRAALSLAASMSRLAQMATLDDAAVVQAVRAQGSEVPLRHLALSLRDEQGALLLGRRPPAPAAAPLEQLARWHAQLRPATPLPPLSWNVPRPDGRQWTLTLTTAPDSERREALHNLLVLLAVLAAGTTAMLAVMAWNLHHALRPLQQLLAGIRQLRAGPPNERLELPQQTVHELQEVNSALQSLAQSLQDEQARRRLLSQQVLSLQEDERASLARDLHDEWGQRLTALRVDAAWLAPRLADQPQVLAVVEGMAQQCEQLQQDTRSLLNRLQPLGPSAASTTAASKTAASTTAPIDQDPQWTSLQRLRDLLQGLVNSWQLPGRTEGTAIELDWQWQAAPGLPNQPPTASEAWQATQVPRALVLALYRISQEALTNVARHADAQQACIQVLLRPPAQAGAALCIEWSCTDDGRGLPESGGSGGNNSALRGNGLAGIRERTWALGADLQTAPATPGAARPGLRLSAVFNTPLRASAAPLA